MTPVSAGSRARLMLTLAAWVVLVLVLLAVLGASTAAAAPGQGVTQNQIYSGDRFSVIIDANRDGRPARPPQAGVELFSRWSLSRSSAPLGAVIRTGLS